MELLIKFLVNIIEMSDDVKNNTFAQDTIYKILKLFYLENNSQVLSKNLIESTCSACSSKRSWNTGGFMNKEQIAISLELTIYLSAYKPRRSILEFKNK